MATKEMKTLTMNGTTYEIVDATARSSINTLNTNKAPVYHASTSDTYGLGKTGAYGHVKTINNLNTSAHADGLALSAYQGKVLNDAITTLNGNKAGAVYNISSMADFYNAVMDGGLILFTGPAALWQSLTNMTGNYSCYGIGRKEGTLALYTVSNGPGSQTFKGRLTSADTIGMLSRYYSTGDTSIITANNSTTGLTARLYYPPNIPQIMCLKITGATTSELQTSSDYANIWDANSFFTTAVGARTTSIIKHVVSGGYRYQLFIETTGLIKIGYTARISDGTSVNIPSGTSLYIEEMIFLK